VTVPQTAATAARVRCPLCREEYTLDEVSLVEAPLLELLDPLVAVAAATDVSEGEELATDDSVLEWQPGSDEITDVPIHTLPAEVLAQDGSDAALAAAAVDAEPTPHDPAEDRLPWEFVEDAEEAVAFEDELHPPEAAVPADEQAPDFVRLMQDAGAEVPVTVATEVASEDGLPGLAAPEDISDAPKSFDFGQAAPAGAKATSVTAARSRRAKPSKNPVAEVVKMVAGGVAGLLIAQAILWWLPGEWKRDPLQLAPKLPGFLAFVAPAALRDVAPGTLTGSGNEGGSGNRTTDQASSGARPPRNPDTSVALNTGGSFDNVGVNALGPGKKPAAGGGKPGESGKGREPDRASRPREPAVNDDPFGAPPELPAEPEVGVLQAPSYGNAELGEALKLAHDAKTEWDAAPPDAAKRRGLARDLYANLCRLGQTVTFVDPHDTKVEGRIEAIRRLLEDLGRDSRNVELIGNTAPGWMSFAGRDSNGVMLAGEVKSIALNGSLFETHLQLSGGKQAVVSVLSKADPSDNAWSTYQEGQQVFVLGSIVTDPSINLAGYEGTEGQVVWGGYAVVIAP